MRPVPGARPSDVQELVRVQDRLSFVYVERGVVHRDGNAITVTDERGTVHVPSATIGALLLGPGTRVTHQAMVVLAESGATVAWVGERGVRYYAHGRTMARSSRWLIRQAEVVSNQRLRLAVARRMYEMRFPGEDVSGLSMQQLRGKEGARVRLAYKVAAETFGVEWSRRDYRPDDFDASDAVNMALSAATTCLYGAVHAVVVSLGCTPGLGVVHTGNDRSFVYDIADLYKVELAVPTAFEVVASKSEDVPGDTRRAMRDAIHAAKLLPRCARDVQDLLSGGKAEDEELDVVEWDSLELWDGGIRTVPGGVSYGDERGG
ncbi:CRISPR-associated protein, Cas1 family [Austwickia chelonae]|uniref:CRISPR-associated endonuclease Cas1 n=1 Tax=Austwickia chelonae NBRC 105200 TaxID=1184607 RepID=K6VVQ2_9MICO|nr:putative CRISPR-associated protein [Austwickia chelonae NBRC 105200]SEW36945.1 CRISPR-associated protein, Cas1 family [Austwickia chelonae]